MWPPRGHLANNRDIEEWMRLKATMGEGHHPTWTLWEKKILICWLLKKRRVFVLMSIFHWALHVKRPSTHWPEKWIFFHSPFPEFSSKLKAQFTHTQRFFDIVSHIYWWCFAVCGAMTSGRTRGIRSWCDNTTRQEPFVVTTRWWWPGQKHW